MKTFITILLLSFFGTALGQQETTSGTSSYFSSGSTTFIPNFGSTTSFTGTTSVETTMTTTSTSVGSSQVTSSQTVAIISDGSTQTSVSPVVTNSMTSSVTTGTTVATTGVLTTTTKTGIKNPAAIHTAHVAGAAMVVVGGVIVNMF